VRHWSKAGELLYTMQSTPIADTSRLLKAPEAAALLGLATGTLHNLRSAGRFAPAIVLGDRALRWEAEDLLTWARSHKEGTRTAGGRR
jgi:predicted DNA-binding transcriptional regulator AlpA